MANLHKVQHLTFAEERGLSKNYKKLALYKCVCGNEVVYEMTEVRAMRKTACGCQRTGSWSVTHGFRNHPLYVIWRLMLNRCYRQQHKSYSIYGGRGILVCQEWHDVPAFVQWCESNGYRKGLQLDRIDTNGNYEPGNCRFVTPKENQNNRRDNFYITYNGETKTLQQWADLTGIKSHTIRKRIVVLKWPLERAMQH